MLPSQTTPVPVKPPETITEEWIKDYVDKLLAYAGEVGQDTPMGRASMLRADHIMDMVKGHRLSVHRESR